MSSHVDGFNTCNKVLTAKLLGQGYRYHILCKAFSKFYGRHFDLVLKILCWTKNTSFARSFNLNFMATWCTNSEKMIDKYDFPYHFKKIIARCKKICHNINVLRQTACLVVNPIKVNNFAYLSDCTTVGRASD